MVLKPEFERASSGTQALALELDQAQPVSQPDLKIVPLADAGVADKAVGLGAAAVADERKFSLMG
jgi:hypothetical protein